MNKINEHNFADLYTISSGISTTKEQAGYGSPFVSFSTIFNNYFLPDALTDLMSTSEKEQDTYSVKEGDIFLTRTSETVDELAMSSVALKDYPCATFSGFAKRLRPKKKEVAYHKYLGFYLRGYLFRQAVTNHSIMTLRSSFNEEIFALLKLYLPEYEQQVKIGDFLYDIDRKITLNGRINAELEKMAQLLYNYWFVQFDFPNAEGKPYRTSGGEMVYSEKLKREIPEGWVVRLVEENYDVLRGTLITEKDARKGNVKVVAAGLEHSYCHAEANRPRNTITISGSGANAGFVRLWREPIFASDCSTVRGKEDIDTLIIYQHLKFIQKVITKKATGSAQPHVYPDDIKTLVFFDIPEQLKKNVANYYIPINDKIAKLQQENDELTALRDFLLPLLMNGQVRVALD